METPCSAINSIKTKESTLCVIKSANVLDGETQSRAVPFNYYKGGRLSWHQRRRHRAILEILRNLEGSVLDYGCGYGDLTCAISKTHRVWGVDLDPQRVAFAQSEYSAIEFRVCTDDSAPYPDESFDVVASVVVLDFIADAQAYLQRVRRMLRPGGHLVVACGNMPYLRNWVRRLCLRPPVLPIRCYKRSREQLRTLLETTIFSVVDESYFYDPPFCSLKNFGDLAFGAIEQILSLLRVRKTASYYIIVAKRNDNSPACSK